MIIISVILALSLTGNVYQLYLSKKTPKNTILETNAADLLHDLTRRGRAILSVEVIDPANLLLRSPRA
jgi:hypothetical protein